MDDDWAERVCAVELGAGIFSLPLQVILLTEDVYSNPWWGLVGFGASAYVIADGVARMHHKDEHGFYDGKGLTEIVLGSPVRLYRHVRERYRLRREIREIDAQAREGEVFV